MPLVEAFQKEITMLPLVVVLTIIAIKDGLEDYRKYKIDKQINNLVTKVYSRWVMGTLLQMTYVVLRNMLLSLWCDKDTCVIVL